MADHLLAVVREALANVARHAHASSAELNLAVRDSRLRLRLADDGVGPSERPIAGRGLDNMRTRAADLGGEMSLSRRDEGGSELVWNVPLTIAG